MIWSEWLCEIYYTKVVHVTHNEFKNLFRVCIVILLFNSSLIHLYSFQKVAYVTYKWPEWLTQQTQKQRIIWGYKILFLDVLFPLNVKKVGEEYVINFGIKFVIKNHF